MSVQSPAADPEFIADSGASGRTAGLRRLYEATAPQLLGLCARILGDAAQAEEVAAETYVVAARHAPADNDGVAWLYAVARDRAIARRRTRDADRGRSTDTEHEPEEVIPVSPSSGLTRLQAALAELTPLQAASIRTAYLDGADYPALAARAATPLGTLKSAMRRGLLRLGDRLDG